MKLGQQKHRVLVNLQLWIVNFEKTLRKSRIKEMMQKEEEFASKESMHVKGI